MKNRIATTSKRFGVRDLARLANVSLGTVDRALNGRGEIKEATRQRILSLARENGYVPNLTARALSFSRSSLKIGLCVPREPRYFYDQIRAGFMDEVHSYSHIGLESIYRPIEKLGSPASRQVRALLHSGIDALVITAGISSELDSLIEEAEEKRNVRVVYFGVGSPSGRRSSGVSVDAELSGAMAAELMAKAVPARSKVAIVTGSLALANHHEKVESFQASFSRECPGGKVVKIVEELADPRKAYEKTLRLLREHRQLAGIYVTTSISIPVCKAVESKGLAGKVKIVSTDIFAESAPWFANGTIYAALYQNPYRQGQTAVRLILENFLNGEPFPPVFHIEPVIALRSNLKLFREIRTASAPARKA